MKIRTDKIEKYMYALQTNIIPRDMIEIDYENHSYTSYGADRNLIEKEGDLFFWIFNRIEHINLLEINSETILTNKDLVVYTHWFFHEVSGDYFEVVSISPNEDYSLYETKDGQFILMVLDIKKISEKHLVYLGYKEKTYRITNKIARVKK